MGRCRLDDVGVLMGASRTDVMVLLLWFDHAKIRPLLFGRVLQYIYIEREQARINTPFANKVQRVVVVVLRKGRPGEC